MSSVKLKLSNVENDRGLFVNDENDRWNRVINKIFKVKYIRLASRVLTMKVVPS